jgi:predicted dehydrogenase
MAVKTGSTISAVVIGLGSSGIRMIDAIQQADGVCLQAVVDQNRRQAEQTGRQFGLEFDTDPRQIILNHKPDVVFLATPPMAWPELLDLCASRGVSVWKETPLARNLEEGAAFYRRFNKAGLQLAVGTQRRFLDTYIRAHELCPRVGDIFLARGHYLFNWGPDLRWRGDKRSAGGGALLEVGYHILDLLTRTLGLPETVYGSTAIENPDVHDANHPPSPPHNTDDSATAILRYADDTMVTLVTSRISGPVSEGMVLHGRDGSITVDADHCTLRNPDGDILDHRSDTSRAQTAYIRQVEAFCRAVRENAPRYEASAAENLLTMAIIEAIYLSHSTGQPESPQRQLHTHGLRVEDCLASAAPTPPQAPPPE